LIGWVAQQQSEVAKQRISAQFENFQTERSILFSNLIARLTNFLWGNGLGHQIPLANSCYPLQEKNHQSEKTGIGNENQKNPKSIMAHLRMLCFF
jgi:hypothetical protein